MPAHRVISYQQLDMLVSYMENHRDFANGCVTKDGPQAKQKMRQQWESIAERLNAVRVGVVKTGPNWRNVWNEQKCVVRKKLRLRNSFAKNTGIGCPGRRIVLTPLEERISALLKRVAVDGEPSVQIPLLNSQLDLLSPPSQAVQLKVLFQEPVDENIAPSPAPDLPEPQQSPEATSSSDVIIINLSPPPAPPQSPPAPRESTSRTTVTTATAAEPSCIAEGANPVDVPSLPWDMALLERRTVAAERLAEASELTAAAAMRTADILQRILEKFTNQTANRMADALENIEKTIKKMYEDV